MQARVRARFPRAAPLPRRPDLDTLLSDSDVPLFWDATTQIFAPRSQPSFTGTRAGTSLATLGGTAEASEVDRRLADTLQRNGFLGSSYRSGNSPVTAPSDPAQYASAVVTRWSPDTPHTGCRWPIGRSVLRSRGWRLAGKDEASAIWTLPFKDDEFEIHQPLDPTMRDYDSTDRPRR